MTELDLWHEYKINNNMDAREKLIIMHLDLAKKAANKVYYTLSMHDISDIRQWAYLGLINAVDLFKPEKGYKFITYAFTRINGSILDEARKLNLVTRNTRSKIKKFEKMKASLESSSGTVMNYKQLKELANECNLDNQEYIYTTNTFENSWLNNSLDEILSNDTNSSDDSNYIKYHKNLACTDGTFNHICNSELTETILNASEKVLSKKEFVIISLTLNHFSSIEIAKKLRIRVKTLHSLKFKALEKLRKHFKYTDITDYLYEEIHNF